jgi:hypothetical protein
MPSFYTTTGPPANTFTERLQRLGHRLDDLAAQLRDGISRAVSEAIAGALEQVVRTVFGARQPEVQLPDNNHRWHPRPHRPAWLQEDAPAWLDPEDSEDDGGDWLDDAPAEHRPTAPSPVSSEPSRATRWLSAVATGVRAAVWWLRRQAPRQPVLTTIAIGLTAAVIALTSSGATGVIGSILGALCVADLARSSAEHLATP